MASGACKLQTNELMGRTENVTKWSSVKMRWQLLTEWNCFVSTMWWIFIWYSTAIDEFNLIKWKVHFVCICRVHIQIGRCERRARIKWVQHCNTYKFFPLLIGIFRFRCRYTAFHLPSSASSNETKNLIPHQLWPNRWSTLMKLHSHGMIPNDMQTQMEWLFMKYWLAKHR